MFLKITVSGLKFDLEKKNQCFGTRTLEDGFVSTSDQRLTTVNLQTKKNVYIGPKLINNYSK